MQVRPQVGIRAAAGLAAAGALVLVLTASKCEEQTTFPAYVQEICTDHIDNNGDGKIDCADPTCSGTPACVVSVSIDALPGIIPADTLTLTGHQTNATAVAVASISPAGIPAAATITGDTWSAKISNLNQKNVTYTVTVVGTNGDRADTARATFSRGD
jgi:hypothetical protein